MKVGYARVSTQDQNLDAQRAELIAAGCSQIFEEKISGTKASRDQLNAMLAQLRPGDTIVITKLDRIARSLVNLLRLFEHLKQNQITLISLKDNIDTSSAMGTFMFQLLGALAELERNIIAERTTAGVRYAMSQGRKPGRRPLPADTRRQILDMRAAGKSFQTIASALNISTKSIQRVIKAESPG